MNKVLLLLFLAGVFMIGYGLLLNNKESKASTSIVTFVPSPTVSPTPQKVLSEKIDPSQTSNVPKSSIQKQTTIVKVYDGDTIETAEGEKIRLLGINAPETGQPYSAKSSQALKEMTLNQTVGFEYDVQTLDRYGRTLAYVYTGETFVNLELIKRGLAVTETIQPNVKYQDLLQSEQKLARDSCKGMWEGLCTNGVLGVVATCITITSIKADAPGDDNKNKNGEWVEFKNTCTKDIPISGWLLKDSSASNKYQFENFTIAGNQTIFLYSGCGSNSFDKLYWKCPEGKYSIWNNNSDHAFLYNEKGELVIDYTY